MNAMRGSGLIPEDVPYDEADYGQMQGEAPAAEEQAEPEVKTYP